MKKFFFRLDILLNLRMAKEVKIERELVFQNQKLAELKEKKGTLERQIASLDEEIGKKRALNERSFEEVYGQIREHLQNSLIQTSSTISSQEKLIEELNERLKRVAIERKVIEKIKEKQYSHWQKQAQAEKGQELDEISTRAE